MRMVFGDDPTRAFTLAELRSRIADQLVKDSEVMSLARLSSIGGPCLSAAPINSQSAVHAPGSRRSVHLVPDSGDLAPLPVLASNSGCDHRFFAHQPQERHCERRLGSKLGLDTLRR